MDKQRAAADIIAHAVPLVPFEGWNQTVLNKAAQAAGYSKGDVIRVFPRGASDAVERFLRGYDQAMQESLAQYHLDSMPIRRRIATIVRARLTAMENDREAIRRALAIQALPFNAPRALRGLYDTVDAMWYAAGDRSADFSFYTRRLLLAGVYSSTLLFWLDDKTTGNDASWAFLDRRIEDVMRIEKAKQRVKNWLR